MLFFIDVICLKTLFIKLITIVFVYLHDLSSDVNTLDVQITDIIFVRNSPFPFEVV